MAGLYFFNNCYCGQTKDKRTLGNSPAITTEIIKQEIIKNSTLVVYTQETTVTISSNDDKKFWFTNLKIPGTTRELKVTIPVTIDITRDLDDMVVKYNNQLELADKRPEISSLT